MKYSLFSINSDNEDFDYTDANYSSAKRTSFNTIDFNLFEEIISYLISSINDGTLSDQNYYIIGDNETETIRFS